MDHPEGLREPRVAVKSAAAAGAPTSRTTELDKGASKRFGEPLHEPTDLGTLTRTAPGRLCRSPPLYSRGVPPIPVPSAAAAGGPVRGALSFAPTYSDDYTGWPVAPKHRTHAVYGTFGNPTTKWPSEMPGLRAGYHKAIDILQNDASGRHPVFAIEGGTVREATLGWMLTPLKERVRSGKISIGHFRYSHVAPSVELGERVEAGQEIGQTCLGFWHMHLEE